MKLLLHSKNSAVRYEDLFVSLGFAAAFLLREAKALGQEKGRRRDEKREKERKWREKRRGSGCDISHAAVLGGMRKMVFVGWARCTVSFLR